MQLFKNQLFKNPPKIIFFDIDGTLYIKEKDAVPESVKDAFYHLQKIILKLPLPQVEEYLFFQIVSMS